MQNEYESETRARAYAVPLVGPPDETPLTLTVAQLREEVRALHEQMAQQQEQIMGLLDAVRIENIDQALAARMAGRR